MLAGWQTSAAIPPQPHGAELRRRSAAVRGCDPYLWKAPRRERRKGKVTALAALSGTPLQDAPNLLVALIILGVVLFAGFVVGMPFQRMRPLGRLIYCWWFAFLATAGWGVFFLLPLAKAIAGYEASPLDSTSPPIFPALMALWFVAGFGSGCKGVPPKRKQVIGL